jgi:5-(carboxyamino)imidazole ribonucleotide synthase
VGVVGAGQLARMMGDEAHDVGVELTVLATSAQDSAVETADHVVLGNADDEAALWQLSRVTDVVTFDHELVDLELLEALAARGAVFRPSPAALRFSVDKSVQRSEFSAAGFPLPRHFILRSDDDLVGLEVWIRDLATAPVLKAARGGYDGRGVLFPSSKPEALTLAREMLKSGHVVVEERVTLLSEVAQVVVRSIDGDVLTYPLVTTVQSDAMCVEVDFPADVDEPLRSRARELGTALAHHVGLVGVMAVEYFVTPDALLINELALRPHNSGHWTIEGATTSQFANHLLAVSGQGLGPADATCTAAVMVNVVGAATPGSLEDARHVEGVHVHDYGKDWRPGRKLGHVTAVGDDPDALHVRAWNSARAYGTTTQEA